MKNAVVRGGMKEEEMHGKQLRPADGVQTTETLSSPGLNGSLSCSKICIRNVNKTNKTVLPSTPLRRYFTLVEHFHILAQIPQVQTGSAAKIGRPAHQ